MQLPRPFQHSRSCLFVRPNRKAGRKTSVKSAFVVAVRPYGVYSTAIIFCVCSAAYLPHLVRFCAVIAPLSSDLHGDGQDPSWRIQHLTAQGGTELNREREKGPWPFPRVVPSLPIMQRPDGEFYLDATIHILTGVGEYYVCSQGLFRGETCAGEEAVLAGGGAGGGFSFSTCQRLAAVGSMAFARHTARS